MINYNILDLIIYIEQVKKTLKSLKVGGNWQIT